MPLLVCRTCPRYEHDAGSFGVALDRVITADAAARGVRVRHVPCVGGCPQPGNIALDSPGKPRVRFSDITPDDADTLLEAASRYDASESGDPDDWAIPRQLRDRLTATTPKRIAGTSRFT